MNRTRLKLITAVFLSAAAVTVLVLQRQRVERLRTENTDLQTRIAQLSQSTEALRQSLSQLPAQPSSPLAGDGEPSVELLRLRAEVARLRQPPEPPPFPSPDATPPPPIPFPDHSQAPTAERIREQVRVWNEGIEQSSGTELTRLATLIGRVKANGSPRYELLFQGSLKDIANPSTAVVIREKNPEKTSEGHWIQGYYFADGHLGRIMTADGDFSGFEARHAVKVVGQSAGEPAAQ